MENLNIIEEYEPDQEEGLETDDENVESNNLDWGIEFAPEKNFWQNTIIPNMIYLPKLCPLCKKKKEDIINPFYLVCNQKNCKKKRTLRYYSFLSFAKRIPASIVHAILYIFVIDKKSAKEIESTIKTKFKVIPSYATIRNILSKFRCCIAEYLKYQYKIKQIGGSPELNRTVASDESLFIHENGNQIWVAGCIDTTTKAVRIDVIPSRNAQNIKIFVQNHILPGSHITHDGWAGYSFLDNNDESVWTHETHNHALGDFGYGLSSTSHIKQFWG